MQIYYADSNMTIYIYIFQNINANACITKIVYIARANTKQDLIQCLLYICIFGAQVSFHHDGNKSWR